MPETAGMTGRPESGSGGQSSTEQAQEKAKEVAGQAQEKARETGHQARERLREQVDQRSTRAGEQIRGNADDVRSFAGQLREQGKDTPARYAEQAADRVQQVGRYLERSDGDRILNDVEGFARRNPWAVAAGGLAIGFAVSRMLKASSSERYRSSLGGSDRQLGGGDRELGGGDRELGGPTASSAPAGVATGGATGARPSQFDPHG
jgi:vacuolar-type H+-ATPase subunit H